MKEIKTDSKNDILEFGESLAKEMHTAKSYEFDLEFPKTFTIGELIFLIIISI